MIVVHVAAWPRDQQQLCKRCHEVLVDGSEQAKPIFKPRGYVGIKAAFGSPGESPIPGEQPFLMDRDASPYLPNEIRCTKRKQRSY